MATIFPELLMSHNFPNAPGTVAALLKPFPTRSSLKDNAWIHDTGVVSLVFLQPYTDMIFIGACYTAGISC